MAITNDYSLLGYLHDAVLHTLCVWADHDGLRRVRMCMTCDKDCGYDVWAGMRVELVFYDVLIVGGFVLGHIVGEEMINDIHPGLLPIAQTRVTELVDAGCGDLVEKITITLHSGSEISLACKFFEMNLQG